MPAEPDRLVSIIIPFYSHPEYLPQALESALGQTHTDLDVIVVDDGSPHDLDALLEPYAGDSRLRVIHQENTGVAAARNAGIAAARGAYLQFLDSDDWLAPEKVERHVAALEAEPDIGLVFCPTYLVEDGAVSGPIDALQDSRWQADRHYFSSFWATNRVVIHAPLTRVEWITQAAGFNTTDLTEDYEMWLRLAAIGCPMVGLSEALVYSRRNPAGRSRDGGARARRVNTRSAIIRRFPDLAAEAAEYGFEAWASIWTEHMSWIQSLEGKLRESQETVAQLTERRDELHQWANHQSEVIARQTAEIERHQAAWAEIHQWAEHQSEVIAHQTAEIERLSRRLAN